jgi:uncharacterized protein (TIGR02996 family)
MTTLDVGFLQAILSDPTEDSLRLIYADSLDERGTHGPSGGGSRHGGVVA